MEHNVPVLFENIPEETLSWEKLFCCRKHWSYCRGELVNCCTVGELTVL